MEMKLPNYQITKLVASDVEVDVMHKSGATYWKLESGQHKKTKSFIQGMTLSKDLIRQFLLVHMHSFHSKISIKSLVYYMFYF